MLRHLLRTVALLLLVQACLLSAESFRNPKLIPTAADPQGLATADLNGDGHLDLVFTTGGDYSQQTLHVLLGRGDGTFLLQPDVLLPQGICGCAINIADVTHDGKLDLILGGVGPNVVQVAVFPGRGDGTFGAALISSAPDNGNYPNTATLKGIADLNGDGAMDLIVADPPETAIYVLLGDNSGTFTVRSRLEDDNYPTAIYTADLNGDGHVDFVAPAETGGATLVYLGRGDGTFSTPVAYNPGSGAHDILADVNGDGHPDLLSTVYNGQLQVRLGNADGTFGALQLLGTAPPAPNGALFAVFDVADYNSDGHADLAYLNSSGIGVLPSTGTLTFGSPIPSLSGSSSTAGTTAGDFNEDGRRDIAMAVEGGIALLFGNGEGSFLSADLYDLGHSPGATAIADFNGDHLPDIAVLLPATQPRLLLGTGGGAFTLAPDPNTTYGPGIGTSSLTVGDFNGDGKVDLAAPGAIYFGNGDGTFLAPLSVPDQTTSVADFNGDGRADTVNVSYNSNGNILVELGQANGTFIEKSTQLRNPTFSMLRAIGDLNGDGKQDIVLSDESNDEVWFGNGDGTFTYGSSLNVDPRGPFGYVSAVPGAIADIDGDGKADLVLTSNTTGTPLVGIFWGNGDGTFAAPTMVVPSHVYNNVALADVNGDSHPDLVLNDDSGIAVIEYQGDRTFSQEDHYVAGSNLGPLSIADVNGDGAPDIVVADTTGTTVAVLLNQPDGTPPGGPHVFLTLTLSPQPVGFGQPFTATLNVSTAAGAPAPTGSVDFLVDGVLYTSTTLVNGGAAASITSSLNPGQHAVQAAYSGDSNYGPATVTVIQTVNRPNYTTTTVLTTTPGAAAPGQTVRLVASVTSTAPGSTPPAGTVSFYDGSSQLGSTSLDPDGNAEYDTALLTAGTHSLTAVYSGYTGFGIYLESTSQPSSVVITAVPTTTVLSVTPANPTVGEVVTLTAMVSSSSSPFGGVSFYDGSTLLGSASLVPASSGNAQASWSTSTLASGQHAFTATFNTNARWSSSTGTASATLSAASRSQHTTFTLLSLSGGLLHATVLDGNGDALSTSAGLVTFIDNGRIVGGVPVVDGTASLPSLLGPGAHALAAGFGGSDGLAPSSSPILSQLTISGADFTLAPAAAAITLPPSGSAAVAVQVFSSAAQSITLTCVAGLPTNYVCSFSPQSVRGSGASTLTITPATTGTLPARGLIGLVVVAAGFGLAGARRRMKTLAVLGCCIAALLLHGCAGTQSPAPMTTSLVVQGVSATGSGSALHQVQILVRTHR